MRATLRYTKRHPWRTLPTLVALCAAASIFVASGATFTASASNPANVFTAGTLSITDSLSGSAILTASNMKPGDTATGTLTIKNSGSLTGVFTLQRGSITDTPGANGGNLSGDLTINVQDTTVPASPVTVYNGSLTGMSSALTLPGTWTAGSQHTYTFTVTFPDGGTPGSSTTGDNAYQGSSVSVPFTWSATT